MIEAKPFINSVGYPCLSAQIDDFGLDSSINHLVARFAGLMAKEEKEVLSHIILLTYYAKRYGST